MSRRYYQPQNTYPSMRLGGGRLRFHHTGCFVDGGPGLPPGVCRKCAVDHDAAYEAAMRQLSRYAKGGW